MRSLKGNSTQCCLKHPSKQNIGEEMTKTWLEVTLGGASNMSCSREPVQWRPGGGGGPHGTEAHIQPKAPKKKVQRELGLITVFI